jgi:hypothetical protein
MALWISEFNCPSVNVRLIGPWLAAVAAVSIPFSTVAAAGGAWVEVIGKLHASADATSIISAIAINVNDRLLDMLFLSFHLTRQKPGVSVILRLTKRS